MGDHVADSKPGRPKLPPGRPNQRKKRSVFAKFHEATLRYEEAHPTDPKWRRNAFVPAPSGPNDTGSLSLRSRQLIKLEKVKAVRKKDAIIQKRKLQRAQLNGISQLSAAAPLLVAAPSLVPMPTLVASPSNEAMPSLRAMQRDNTLPQFVDMSSPDAMQCDDLMLQLDEMEVIEVTIKSGPTFDLEERVCLPPGNRYPKPRNHKSTSPLKLYPDMKKECDFFYGHKVVFVNPILLTENGIRFGRVYQKEKEFIVAFPHGWHMGMNHGFNIAEVINGNERWIPYGRIANSCKKGKCSYYNERFRINMDRLVGPEDGTENQHQVRFLTTK